MATADRTTIRKALRSGAWAVLFFVPLFLYVWLAVDARLVHHALGILTPYSPFCFHTGWPFLREHLAQVGGPADYAVRLLTQCYAFGWAGALIVAAAAWCTSLFAEGLSRRAGLSGGGVVRFVPAAIVLVMYCGYSHPLAPLVSLLAALGAYRLYVRLAPRAPAARLAVLVLACAAIYYLAGAGGMFFAWMAAIDESLIGKRRALAAAALACALVLPWAASALSGLGLEEAYAGFLVSAPGVAPGRWSHTLALYLFFPTVLAGSVLWGNAGAGEALAGAKALPPAPLPARPPARPPRPVRKSGRESGRQSRSFSLRPAAPVVAAGAFFCGVAAAAWFSLDWRTRAVLELDYYAQQELWTEVLRSADRLPAGVYNPRCNRNILLALYHAGRLGDELFRYPQRRDMDLFSAPAEHRDLGAYFQESRLYLDLGQVNLAERCAYEALATSGEQPAILEHLAMIHVVTGRPETAKLYLCALARHPFYGRAAEEMLRRLDADPALENDPRASRIRANAATRDVIVQEASAEDFLRILLEKNPHNQMAFELLMACYLCDGRPEKVVANLSRLRDFSYARVPRHYQEAWAVGALSSGRPPAVAGFEIDPEVLRRAREFQRIVAGAGSTQEAVRAALEAGLGDSYFFYLAYGVSGG